MKLDEIHDLNFRLGDSLHEPIDAPLRRALEPRLGYGRHDGPARHDARGAATAILLYRQSERWMLPLTLRPVELRRHAGQISLPGGMIDPGESSRQAALRELNEELGVASAEVVVLGRLRDVCVFASNTVVSPWVAYWPRPGRLRPDPREVAGLLEAPLTDIVTESCRGQHTIRRGGLEFTAPHLEWRGHRVWGATAVMLGELLAHIERAAR